MSKELIDNLFELQVDSLNQKSRMKFRNALSKFVIVIGKNDNKWEHYFWQHFGEDILAMQHEDIYLNNTLSPVVIEKFNKFFQESQLTEIFSLLSYVLSSSDFMEENQQDAISKIFSLQNLDDPTTRLNKFIFNMGKSILKTSIIKEMMYQPMFEKNINKILSEEKIAYILNKEKFVPHYPKEAQTSIDEAMNLKHVNPAKHIKKAVVLLEHHQNPDYANSIKESISAVESLAVEISGEGSFDKAIAQLEQNGILLHPQFAAAIKNMYRFTSDEDGVRHGASGEPLQCNPATARYMLIICSAMVNFIVASTS